MSSASCLRRSRLRACIGLWPLVTLGGAVSAYGQTVQPREAASLGDDTVHETDIALGPNEAIAVYIDGDGIGYTVRTGALWVAQGLIPLGNFDRTSSVADPSVAFDPQTGDFLTAALLVEPVDQFIDDNHVVVSRYDADPMVGAFGPWTSIAVRRGAFATIDKPFLVADQVIDLQQEYYVVYMDNGGGGGPATGYAYRRSIDGGQTWFPPDPADGIIKVNGERITGVCCAQPAAAGYGPLYVAYMVPVVGVSTAKIRFLKGTDNPDGSLSFAYLTGLIADPPCFVGPLGPGFGGPLEIPINDRFLGDKLPGSFESKTVPQLVADPSNPNRLYIVYQDAVLDLLTCQVTSDVDIFIRRIDRIGSIWSLGGAVRVNDDATPFESDQFMPSVTVDDQGRVHVIFYDDRDYNVLSDQLDGALNPQFDVFYAVSTDHGVTFDTNLELCDDPPECIFSEPALKFEILPPGFQPLEYIGIAYDPGEDEIITSFTGSDSDDRGPSDLSVIYSSRVTALPPPPP